MSVPATPEKVVFYFPWKEVSGGPYFLTRLAEALSENPAYDVYYTDFEPGLSDDLLTSGRVKKLVVEKEGDVVDLTDAPVTLVTPVYWASYVAKLHPDSRILFFNWHVCCLPVMKTQWGVDNKQADAFLALLKKKDALFFCDYSHWMGQNTKAVCLNKKYVPIPFPERQAEAGKGLVKEGEINVVTVGRLCQDKIYSVVNLLDNLGKLKTPLKKVLHVIGDGACKDVIDLRRYPDVEIRFTGTLSSDALSGYLQHRADILFAMGTSVLEGAALKLPSVVIPHNMAPFDCDRYVYLQDSRDYCLGWYDTQMDDLKMCEYTLGQIVEDVYAKGQKAALGEASYRYYMQNHTIEASAELFVRALKETQLTFRDFSRLSATFFFKYRRYVVLGIPFIRSRRNKMGALKGRILELIPFQYAKKDQDKYHVLSICGVPLLRVGHKSKGTVVVKPYVPALFKKNKRLPGK